MLPHQLVGRPTLSLVSALVFAACEQKDVPVVTGALLSVKIVSPLPGDSLLYPSLIKASVQHTHPIVAVEFYADSVRLGVASASPYAYRWNAGFFADGLTHLLTARVTDDEGNKARSSPVAVRVDTSATALRFTYPRNGWTIYGPLVLTLDTTDLASARQVMYFVDGQEIASIKEMPFTTSWSAGYWADGATHEIHAVASDSSGKTGRSETIHVVVSPNAAIYPAAVSPAGGTYVGSSEVTFSWNSVPDAVKYDVEVSEFPDVPGMVLSSTDTLVLWESPPKSLYSWRVRAENAIGRHSAWGNAEEFGTTSTFERLISPNSSGIVQSVVEASGGGYVVAGQSFGPIDEVLVARLDSSGNILWERSTQMYEGHLIESSDGSFVVVGMTRTNGAAAMKLDVEGKVVWSKTFTPFVGQGFRCGTALTDGSVIAAGFVIPQHDPPTMADPMQGWLAKISSSGDTLLTRIYRRSGNLLVESVGIRSDGLIGMAGTFSAAIDSFSFLPQISWLACLDQAWDTTWYREFDWDMRSMSPGPASSLIMGGSRQTNSGALIHVAKVTAAGDVEWSEDFGGPGYHYAALVIPSLSGGYVATGGHQADTSPQVSFLLSVDEGGNERWIKKRGVSNAFSLSVCPALDGGYLVGGTSVSGFSNRMWVYKTDRYGRVRFGD